MGEIQIEFQILQDTLTRTQEECTKLLLEKRKLNEANEALIKLVQNAQQNWNNLLQEKARAWDLKLQDGYSLQTHLKRLRLEE